MTQDLKSLSIKLIDSNPWQVRSLADDLVDQLAASIKRDGVLQPPIVRPHPTVAGRYQLAFGHHRLAAAKKAGLTEVIAEVRKLADRDLAELAIRENSERRDLSPIEEAQAMRRYMDSFNVTPKEAAKVFGIEATTLRKKVQLLELSPKASEAIGSGALPERVGRRLIGLSRANPAAADKLATQLAASPDKSDQEREWEIQRAMEKAMTILAGQYDHGRVKGDLWMLDAVFQKLKGVELTVGQVTKAIENAVGAKKAKAAAQSILARFGQNLSIEEQVQLYGENRAAVEIISQLQAPPACTTCVYHTEIGDQHFCALKACYDLKRATFIAEQVKTGMRRAGVPLYDKAKDGPALNLSDDYNLRDRGPQLKAKGNKDLRARGRHTPNYNADPTTRSKWLDLVVIGKTRDRIAAERSSRNSTPDYAAQRKQDEERRAQVTRVQRLAAPHFAALFAGMADWKMIKLINAAVNEPFYGYQSSVNPALPDTASYFAFDDRKLKPAERVRLYQLQCAYDAIPNLVGGKAWRKGTAAVLKAVTGSAQALGVRLPDGWEKAEDTTVPSEQTLERRQFAAEQGVDESEVVDLEADDGPAE